MKLNKINHKKNHGLSVIEVIITTGLIAIVAYIGMKLIMNYNEQFEWGSVVSTVSTNAVNALDSIENELVQASASSIVLTEPDGYGGFKTIEFPKVIGYNVTSKFAIIDTENALRFTLECNVGGSDCSLNKYVINKSSIPPTVVSGPITIANNVADFAVQVLSEYNYKISITVKKSYSDGRQVSSSYERTIYVRNK